MSRRSHSAFTLIELLTVIAITAVLLTIIVVPVIQSFNLTREAQAFAEAQDRARVLTEKISREISNSVGVRDLSAYVTSSFNGQTVQVPASTLMVTVPAVNPSTGLPVVPVQQVQVKLPYSKVDIMLPAQSNPYDSYSSAGGSFHNPGNGYVDPTLHKHTGQVVFPVAAGQSLVRYWIGLRQPIADDTHALPYNDPHSGLLMASNNERDNLYVLYRAEVQPYIYSSAAGKYVANTAYFQVDGNGNISDEDDPNFFNFIPGTDVTTDGSNSLTASGLAKRLRMQKWQANAVLQSEISRYDLIAPVYDKSSRAVKNIGGVPLLISLAQFRPSRISAESVAGASATRLGDESTSSASVAPDVFLTQFGQWSNPVVRTYPMGWQPGATASQAADYEVGRRDVNLDTAIWGYRPGVDVGDDLTSGTPLFDLDVYDSVAASGGLYPFSQAVQTANLTPEFRQIFTPYSLNRQLGKVISSFWISEVGNPATPPTSANPQNLPSMSTGSYYTPANDPNVGSMTFDKYNNINQEFNQIWTDHPELRPNIHRFIYLRVLPNADGTYSPLYPDPLSGVPSGFGRVLDASGNVLYSKGGIVPGSEQVFGPNALSTGVPGEQVLYTRVSQNPGPNQYCINYTDLVQPTNATTGAIDYTVAFPNASQPLPTYVSSDFTTAVLQPRYKAGYIQFCSDPDIPLPAGNITVNYRFQFTGKLPFVLSSQFLAQSPQLATSDSFSVDYDSRQLMDVLLTVRNYPQATLNPNPQTVTLKSTAKVRNYQR